MDNWQKDKKWANQFLPQIKQILGLYLIGEAPQEEDVEHNTDLIVLRMNAVRIACRVRRSSYYERYAEDFTIRAERPNEAKTELAKIVEGWGDYFFYGHAGERSLLRAWNLGRLDVFRLWFNGQICKNHGEVPGQLLVNHDGSSKFRVFKWAELPKSFWVASLGRR